MTIRVLIVDDEAPARERLRRFLQAVQEVEILGEAQNGIQAVEMIEAECPDLVLLDIQMPGLDGFGVLETLHQPPPIIFVTAYDEYAIRAFEVNALDYLLKPFSQERLEEAIQRVTISERGDDFTNKFASLLATLADREHYITRLAVWDRSNIRLLEVDEVDWIGVEGKETIVHIGEAFYPVRHTLAELEKKLNPKRFYRAHRSAIVNLDRVTEIIPWFKGTHKLRLSTGVEVDLSRTRARQLKKLLDW
jgi:two-component system LytT family response regulator